MAAIEGAVYALGVTASLGSKADRDVVAKLRSDGVPITERKLRRWRDIGYGAPTARRWLGRKGSASFYSAESVAYLQVLANGARPRHPLYRIVLTQFAQGRGVPERPLRTAYRDLFRQLSRFVVKHTEADDDWTADAIALAIEPHLRRTPHGRIQARRLGSQGEARTALLVRAIAALVRLTVLERPVSGDDLKILLRARGLTAMAVDRPFGLGPVAPSVEDIGDWIRKDAQLLSVRSLASRIQTAGAAELAQARDEWKEILSFTSLVGAVISAETGLPDASGFGTLRGLTLDDPEVVYCGAPAVLAYRQVQGPALDRVLEVARRETPRHAAIATLLTDIPIPFRSYLAPDGVARLAQFAEDERNKILEAFQNAARRHPAEAAVLGASVST